MFSAHAWRIFALTPPTQQIVWQHNSYTEGDELKLFELVKQLSEGKTIAE
jgi:hypothetical protein